MSAIVVWARVHKVIITLFGLSRCLKSRVQGATVTKFLVKKRFWLYFLRNAEFGDSSNRPRRKRRAGGNRGNWKPTRNVLFPCSLPNDQWLLCQMITSAIFWFSFSVFSTNRIKFSFYRLTWNFYSSFALIFDSSFSFFQENSNCDRILE